MNSFYQNGHIIESTDGRSHDSVAAPNWRLWMRNTSKDNPNVDQYQSMKGTPILFLSVTGGYSKNEDDGGYFIHWG